jgi:hypothetical protein
MRALLFALLVLLASPSLAHERVEVGPFVFAVGQLNEPAMAGEVNGLDLIIRRKADNSPVVGAERSLAVEIIGPSGQRRVYKWSEDSKDIYRLRPQSGADRAGRYQTKWILAVPGQYQVRVFGEIEGTRIDFTVGGPTFSIRDKSLFEIR